jgi:hypothetical protein
MNRERPTNSDEAKQLGWEVDDTCYPWVAYVGSRFDPTDWCLIDTPAYKCGDQTP